MGALTNFQPRCQTAQLVSSAKHWHGYNSLVVAFGKVIFTFDSVRVTGLKIDNDKFNNAALTVVVKPSGIREGKRILIYNSKQERGVGEVIPCDNKSRLNFLVRVGAHQIIVNLARENTERGVTNSSHHIMLSLLKS